MANEQAQSIVIPVTKGETPYAIAFAIDGVIYDVLHTQKELAAVMLSTPEIINVTAWYEKPENAGKNLVRATVNPDGSFTLPQIDVIQPPQHP